MDDSEPKLPAKINDLTDAERECETVIRQVKNGTMDLKTADTILKAIKTYAEIYVSRLKNDPRNEAQKEYARGVARKAVDQIDTDKAREMLLSRNFTALEDQMGIVDAEVVTEKAEEALKQLKRVEAPPPPPTREIF
jgi:hypothetical protein